MRNNIPVWLLCFFLMCQVHGAQAAFRIKNVYSTNNSQAAASYQGNFTNEITNVHRLTDSTRHSPAAKAKKNNGLQGRLAFTFGMLGLIFQPLGVVAMYFGVRGWKKGTYRRGLAIAGFILGTIEVLISLFILALILG